MLHKAILKFAFINAAKPYQIEMRESCRTENHKTLNTQKIGATDKYIVGTYDIEILTLPRIYVTVNVEQSATTTIRH